MRGPDVHGAIEDAHGPAYSGARWFGMADPCLLRFDPEVNATRDVGRPQSSLGRGGCPPTLGRGGCPPTLGPGASGPLTTLKERCRAEDGCPARLVGVHRNGSGIAESLRSHDL